MRSCAHIGIAVKPPQIDPRRVTPHWDAITLPLARYSILTLCLFAALSGVLSKVTPLLQCRHTTRCIYTASAPLRASGDMSDSDE